MRDSFLRLEAAADAYIMKKLRAGYGSEEIERGMRALVERVQLDLIEKQRRNFHLVGSHVMLNEQLSCVHSTGRSEKLLSELYDHCSARQRRCSRRLDFARWDRPAAAGTGVCC